MKSPTEQTMPTFPALHFLVKHGDPISLVLALSVPAIGFWQWTVGGSFALLIGGGVAGAFAYLILRSYVDLVRLVVDAMLPK
ncbi:hypothetical protein RA280_13750 [Cupriavidus sp. CV2]|uniref:hypothetical protein n=1 Tax=Cupriavidus ulmosensis TaxID=3065913 RepID=UPI00296B2C93|nr:hypothetical protein [Cupriavidus sp. CV2]MDW3682789.1 hypothetical protein [Cupriavidus sp. CV2]